MGNGHKRVPVSSNSSERRFPKIGTRMGGQHVSVRRIICSTPSCKKEGEILDNTHGGLPSTEVIKRLIRKGWDVGSNEKHDLCPDCVATRSSERRARRIKPIPEIKTNVLPFVAPEETSMPAEPMVSSDVQEIGRADRRIIFAHLEEVYESEETGYKPGWTDQAVAKHLGDHIPVGWVSRVREENFGPVKDNAEIRGMLERVKSGTVDAQAILDDAKQFRVDLATMVKRANDLFARATEVGKTLHGLQVLADRIEHSLK